MDRVPCTVPLPDFAGELRDIIKNAGSASRGAVGLARDLLHDVEKLKPEIGLWSYDGKKLHCGAHSYAAPKKFGAAVVAVALRYREWFEQVKVAHPTMVGVELVKPDKEEPNWHRFTADEAADKLEMQMAGVAVLVPGTCALAMHKEVAGELHFGCDEGAVWPPEYPEFCCIEHAGLHAMLGKIEPPAPDEEQLEDARDEARSKLLTQVAELLDLELEGRGLRDLDKIEEAVLDELAGLDDEREDLESVEQERDALVDQVRLLSGFLAMPSDQCAEWLERYVRSRT